MDQSCTPDSTPSLNPQSTSSAKRIPHNPYQRIASRRAIACVTCAKAKTKCDKGLPHCSRCVTKGIKCEPRSTRRTAENSYRHHVRRAYVSPKQYSSTGTVPCLSRHRSSRTRPSTRQRMPAVSHIDLENAIKMSQQSHTLSGFPFLTPLSTHVPHLSHEGRTDDTVANQSFINPTAASNGNSFPASGRLTPQTPDTTIYREPLTMNMLTNAWINDPSWSDDSLMSLGSSYDSNMSALLPAELWSATDCMIMQPMDQICWTLPQHFQSPQCTSGGMAAQIDIVSPLSIGEHPADDRGNSDTFQRDWINCEAVTSQIDLSGLVSCASLMSDLTSFPGTLQVWEDVYIPAPPY